jgi:hypothetical protein
VRRPVPSQTCGHFLLITIPSQLPGSRYATRSPPTCPSAAWPRSGRCYHRRLSNGTAPASRRGLEFETLSVFLPIGYRTTPTGRAASGGCFRTNNTRRYSLGAENSVARGLVACRRTSRAHRSPSKHVCGGQTGRSFASRGADTGVTIAPTGISPVFAHTRRKRDVFVGLAHRAKVTHQPRRGPLDLALLQFPQEFGRRQRPFRGGYRASDGSGR